jgi:hypothetical protein
MYLPDWVAVAQSKCEVSYVPFLCSRRTQTNGQASCLAPWISADACVHVGTYIRAIAEHYTAFSRLPAIGRSLQRTPESEIITCFLRDKRLLNAVACRVPNDATDAQLVLQADNLSLAVDKSRPALRQVHILGIPEVQSGAVNVRSVSHFWLCPAPSIGHTLLIRRRRDRGSSSHAMTTPAHVLHLHIFLSFLGRSF